MAAAAQQLAILTIIILTVPIDVAGRALLEAPPAIVAGTTPPEPRPTSPASAAAFLQPPQAPPAPATAFLQPPPPAPAAAAAAAVLLQPPPASPTAAVVLHPPLPPLPPADASAILQHPPADQQPTSYHIHLTKIGLLGVTVSFLAGCFICALFIVFVARSRSQATRAQAADGPSQDVGEGPPTMESTALRCLSCLTRVAAFVQS